MKILIGLFLFCGLLFGALSPNKSVKASGLVTDIYANEKYLYAASDAGTVDIFDLSSFKKTKSISFAKTADFMGNMINAKVYSVDVLNNKILTAVQDKQGYRSIYLDDAKIIGDSAKLFVKKAKFISNDLIVLGLLSNEIILFDIKAKKQIYKIQVNTSTFGDFAISEDKSKIVIGDESGDISLFDVKTGKKLRMFKGQNVDNIYQIDFKKGVILGCGQDRRASVYFEGNQKPYYMDGEFLIYSGALSKSAKLGAFAFNDKNDLRVFDINTKQEIAVLNGSKANVSRTIFLNESEIIASSEDKQINYWRIK